MNDVPRKTNEVTGVKDCPPAGKGGGKGPAVKQGPVVRMEDAVRRLQREVYGKDEKGPDGKTKIDGMFGPETAARLRAKYGDLTDTKVLEALRKNDPQIAEAVDGITRRIGPGMFRQDKILEAQRAKENCDAGTGADAIKEMLEKEKARRAGEAARVKESEGVRAKSPIVAPEKDYVGPPSRANGIIVPVPGTATGQCTLPGKIETEVRMREAFNGAKWLPGQLGPIDPGFNKPPLGQLEDIDPGFNEPPVQLADIDPGFNEPPVQLEDIDPGFNKAPGYLRPFDPSQFKKGGLTM